ncbi:MAG: exodeoxyribonuclease VII large subunit [Chloroflexi bacterium]|nr:exodeoxyribonuclease VII large subunit [Chloroflexota bacterium]
MKLLAVGELVAFLRRLLESEPALQDIWVRGEVSNLTTSSAGHTYFTLKDAQGQLRCVMFRGRYGAHLLAHGALVSAHGAVSIYETRGELQFYVDMVQPEGLGLLHLEYERLKARLQEEGLFDPAHKRPLPRFPQHIGIVTSPTGAVFHDMVHVLERRYPLVEVVFAPSPVQGDGAGDGVVAALQALWQEPAINVIIVARGGGSLEELWAFNEEKVVRAIYKSPVPVITGVGHDTDFTLSDFAADCRAPTPSAAAEVAVPDRADLLKRLGTSQRRAQAALDGLLAQRRHQLQATARRLTGLAPDLASRRHHLLEVCSRARAHLDKLTSVRREQVHGMAGRLSALSPLATLGRGYALVHHASSGTAVRHRAQVATGDRLSIQVVDGSFAARVSEDGHGQG